MNASARQTIWATPVELQVVVVAVTARAVVIELELLVVEPVVVPVDVPVDVLVELVASTSDDLQPSKRLLKPTNKSRKIDRFLRFIMKVEQRLLSA